MGKSAGIRWAAVALVLATTAFLLACGKIGAPGAGTSPYKEVDVRFEMAKAPKLYEPVEVTVSITPRKPMQGPIEAWLALPPSVAFINGQTLWKGNIPQGRTARFSATIAFVVEGYSELGAIARYPTAATTIGTDETSGGTWLRVTTTGSVVKPTVESGEPSYLPPGPYLFSGSELLNGEARPRLLLIYGKEGLEELRRQGLVPAEPWGRWHRRAYDSASVLDDPYADDRVMVALYDRRRPTTGYHFAVLHMWGATTAQEIMGLRTVFPVGDPTPRPREVVVLDVIATPPQPGWPVEQREVSPYHLEHVSYSRMGEDGTLDLVVRINQQVVVRHTLVRGAKAFEELPLP